MVRAVVLIKCNVFYKWHSASVSRMSPAAVAKHMLPTMSSLSILEVHGQLPVNTASSYFEFDHVFFFSGVVEQPAQYRLSSSGSCARQCQLYTYSRTVCPAGVHPTAYTRGTKHTPFKGARDSKCMRHGWHRII